MTAPEREDELDAYLRRGLSLHRQLSELESIEPPHDLDRVVLRQARQAIRSSPDVPIFRAPRWALPVGLAATLLLTVAVGVSFVMHTHAARPLAAARQAPPATDSMLAEVTVVQSAANTATRPVLAKALPDPAAWLRRIDTLRAQGKAADADRELRRFRAVYPYYPLSSSGASPAGTSSGAAHGASPPEDSRH